MERLSLIQARLASIRQLQEVVAAMRSLAATHMQQAAEAIDGARRYADIIAGALSGGLDLLRGPPERAAAGRRGLLLFSGEHGFVGGYYESLAEAARTAAADRLFVVGSRGALAVRDSGLAVHWSMPMTTHLAGAAETARRAADELYRRFAGGELTRLDMIYGALEDGSRWRIARASLLPLDLSRFRHRAARQPAAHYLAPAVLLDRLIEEYFFSDLVRATVEALGSENAARLQAMSAAYDNIERKLDQLADQERQMRQEQITEEILDLVTGSEALLRP